LNSASKASLNITRRKKNKKKHGPKYIIDIPNALFGVSPYKVQQTYTDLEERDDSHFHYFM
jgi:hypothetical protein